VSDVFLVVEVSDTTLAFDLKVKVPLYARCGIAEAWVVDVNERDVRVFRDAAATGYSTTVAVGVGQRVACVAVPEIDVEVGELFPG
jgi:Uma2 family endonuclease